MLKTSLIAAAILTLGTAGALANQDWRYHHGRAYHHHHVYAHHPASSLSQWENSPQAYSGVNRFCGPGQIPEPFPGGAGVRCELPGGGYNYY